MLLASATAHAHVAWAPCCCPVVACGHFLNHPDVRTGVIHTREGFGGDEFVYAWMLEFATVNPSRACNPAATLVVVGNGGCSTARKGICYRSSDAGLGLAWQSRSIGHLDRNRISNKRGLTPS